MGYLMALKMVPDDGVGGELGERVFKDDGPDDGVAEGPEDGLLGGIEDGPVDDDGEVLGEGELDGVDDDVAVGLDEGELDEGVAEGPDDGLLGGVEEGPVDDDGELLGEGEFEDDGLDDIVAEGPDEWATWWH
eukprot:TRINITY_DN7219_c0_g1_i2.p1 TRINITY_DN7219_c0_g1~~TRINITY_DN7219_c0_g1_i2.p1  ORF type:complete len:141 (+),score=77.77 TRINITY_DN7219_c0_g1_i2:26-424(+)